MSEPSIPNVPPERYAGPAGLIENIARTVVPLNAPPNTPAWMPFQAQWMPIGNHNERLNMNAAPRSTPACRLRPSAATQVALSLLR